MGTHLILAYILALLCVLLGIAGIIMLIYGLVNKTKKLTIVGSIFTFLSVVILVSGIFCAIGQHACREKKGCHKEMNCRMHICKGDKMCMDKDSLMDDDDMEEMAGDSGKVCIERKIVVCGKEKKCGSDMKCSPSECKKKCDKEKE